MKQITSGPLGPVFHPGGRITLLGVTEAVDVGEQVIYVMPNFHKPGKYLGVGIGTVISVDGDSVTIDKVVY